jgi:GntR family transcriptional regulator
MYLKIAADIREQIDAGALARGAQLPTEADLSEKYRASRNTIRDAIKCLASQGLVESRPGQGRFVTMRIDPLVTMLTGDPRALGGAEGATDLSDVGRTRRGASLSVPRVEIQAPPAEICRRLRIAARAPVVSRHQRRYVDDIPWSLQTSFYPMDFVTHGATRLLMAEDLAEGTVSYIAEVLAIRQVGYRDWITARSSDPNEQAFFGLAHDAAVFEIFRTAFDQTGTPLRVTVTVFPTDRNQFIINVGDVPEPTYEADETASESA